MKIFAVIDKAQDCLVAFPSAWKKSQLVGRFPESQFDLVDMTGKGTPPTAPGLMADDVTVDRDTKDWKIKGKTVTERMARADTRKIMTLRHRFADLENRKNTAAGMGDDYAEVLVELQAKIDSTKAEIAELSG